MGRRPRGGFLPDGPEHDGAVRARTGEKLPIGRKRHARDLVHMPGKPATSRCANTSHRRSIWSDVAATNKVLSGEKARLNAIPVPSLNQTGGLSSRRLIRAISVRRIWLMPPASGHPGMGTYKRRNWGSS